MFFVNSISSAAPLVFDANTIPDRIKLLNAAEQTLSSMKSSQYQHVTYVDESSGVYDFDCSGFVDYVLQRTFPDALAAISYHPNRLNRPSHQDFYRFFARLGTDDSATGWIRVNRVHDLRPGDIIAWLKPNRTSYSGIGHVMIVRSIESAESNEVNVQIIDSTRSPHAFDSRVNGTNGLGMGTLSIVLNSVGDAVGFRWRDGLSAHVEYAKMAFGELDSSKKATYGRPSLNRIHLPEFSIILMTCVSLALLKLKT